LLCKVACRLELSPTPPKGFESLPLRKTGSNSGAPEDTEYRYCGKPQVGNEQPSLKAKVCVIVPSSEQVHWGVVVVSHKIS
jgi:hypothetical protein